MQMEDVLTVKQVDDWIRKELSELYGEGESGHFSLLIFNHLRGYERKDMLMNSTSQLTQEEMAFISESLSRLQKEEPIQYVLGFTEFYGLVFKTDHRALIPRPETEELVDWILQDKPEDLESVLDVGTGSGCIAISLKKFLPDSFVQAWDISQRALNLAMENASLNKVKVDFQLKDVLNSNLKCAHSLDLLVSNPPYVTMHEKSLMKSNVLNFEPHNALFVEDDKPLLFYHAIARLGRENLRKGGWLYFEINESLGAEMEKLLGELGYSGVELKKDLHGRYRMIRAVWNA